MAKQSGCRRVGFLGALLPVVFAACREPDQAADYPVSVASASTDRIRFALPSHSRVAAVGPDRFAWYDHDADVLRVHSLDGLHLATFGGPDGGASMRVSDHWIVDLQSKVDPIVYDCDSGVALGGASTFRSRTWANGFNARDGFLGGYARLNGSAPASVVIWRLRDRRPLALPKQDPSFGYFSAMPTLTTDGGIAYLTWPLTMPGPRGRPTLHLMALTGLDTDFPDATERHRIQVGFESVAPWLTDAGTLVAVKSAESGDVEVFDLASGTLVSAAVIHTLSRPHGGAGTFVWLTDDSTLMAWSPGRDAAPRDTGVVIRTGSTDDCATRTMPTCFREIVEVGACCTIVAEATDDWLEVYSVRTGFPADCSDECSIANADP